MFAEIDSQDLAERMKRVSDLIDAGTIARAMDGSLEDRQKILVLLALSPLRQLAQLPTRDEQYATVLEILVERFRRDSSEWTAVAGYDYCASLAREFIWLGRPLPAQLDAFVIGVLDGTIKRVERGPRAFQNDFRDAAVLSAVYAALTVKGLTATATRNDATDPISACDVVSDCLQMFGVELSYNAVAKIWAEWRHSLKRQGIV